MVGVRGRSCCGCCDLSIAYHFVGIYACIELLLAIIIVILGFLIELVNLIMISILVVWYIRGNCGQDLAVRIEAKRTFPTVFLVYFIIDTLTVLSTAIRIKVVNSGYSYYNGSTAFWVLMVWLTLYVTFCSYLYCVLKEYYLVEKQNYDTLLQIQPELYGQP